jgi:hypothetical protein
MLKLNRYDRCSELETALNLKFYAGLESIFLEEHGVGMFIHRGRIFKKAFLVGSRSAIFLILCINSTLRYSKK